MLRYYDFVNAELKDDIHSFQEKLLNLTGTERELTATEQKMVLKREELKQEVVKLRSSRDERKQALAALNKALADDKDKLKQLQLDQKRLRAILAEIEKSLNFATLIKPSKSFAQLKVSCPGRQKEELSRVLAPCGTIFVMMVSG